jgi:hypothetical protein
MELFGEYSVSGHAGDLSRIPIETVLFYCDVIEIIRATRVSQWSEALHSIPGYVTASRDMEPHRAMHTWPSAVWVRGGFLPGNFPWLLTL